VGALPVNVDLLFRLIQVIVVLITSFVVLHVIQRFIRHVTEERIKVTKGRLIHVNRFFQLVIISIAVILILWTFNIDITGLIAGLGIGALVLGFALKEIIENWVSGLIIITGKTYNIADMITVGGLTGEVTDISLRTTKLKTYDRNEVIIPNAVLLNEKIINHTSGRRETVSSIITSIDYIYDVDHVKQLIDVILRNHPHVVVNPKRQREIRFVTRTREWATDIEALFWINQPDQEVFIKSTITEAITQQLANEHILPPIPSIIRREYLERNAKRSP
jgi:small-conductance mechanosensitive channel